MNIELDAADADVISEALQRLAVDLDATRRLLGPSVTAAPVDKAVRVALLLHRLRPLHQPGGSVLPRA
ncbi:MAG: hypothetical protein U1E53_30470 [Dongiaceae bacterium]